MWEIWSDFSHVMYSAEYEITLSNLVKLFASVKYSIEFLMFDLLSRIFYIWYFRQILVREIRLDFSHVVYSVQYVTSCMTSIFATYVQYIIEFLTFGIIGRVDYTWHYGEYRCEKFGRIFHMWWILSNISLGQSINLDGILSFGKYF